MLGPLQEDPVDGFIDWVNEGLPHFEAFLKSLAAPAGCQCDFDRLSIAGRLEERMFSIADELFADSCVSVSKPCGLD